MTNPYASPRSPLDTAEPEYYTPRMFALRGRIGRLRYIVYSTIVTIVVLVLVALLIGLLADLNGPGQAPDASFGWIIAIGIYLPFLISYFVMVKRRLNDLDHSGWLSLLMLVPMVNILFGLYVLLWPGSPGSNRFGPPPRPNSRLLIFFGVVVPVILVALAMAVSMPAYKEYVRLSHQLQPVSAPEGDAGATSTERR